MASGFLPAPELLLSAAPHCTAHPGLEGWPLLASPAPFSLSSLWAASLLPAFTTFTVVAF